MSTVVDSLCCPSRTSILTGNYSHTTGIYSNTYPYGGFGGFTVRGEDRSTIATWLQSAGYRTALVGKYLNQYSPSWTDGSYVPPGWDEWAAIYPHEGGSYYGYRISRNGILRSYGHARADYSTDVPTHAAVRFIRSTTSPFFLYYAPSAPHLPATPAPRDRSAFSHLKPWRPPGYDERDVLDNLLGSAPSGRSGHRGAGRSTRPGWTSSDPYWRWTAGSD
jgi:arylsulfatase A-like enzyme